MTAMIGVEVHHGVGAYDKDMPASTVVELVVANNNLWILIVNITKASIVVQYLRIFSSRAIRLCCCAILLILLPVACWGVFGGTFLCSPTAKLWKPELPGHCMSARNYWYSVAGMNIGLDFITLLLPLPAIHALHLPGKQKFGLMFVFLLGFFVCIVSIARVVTVHVAAAKGDYVASGVWAIIWSAVEANVGIMCASLLAVKPLVVHLFPKLMEETEPPRHSMKLPMIEAGVWPAESSNQSSSFIHKRPDTPTTLRKTSSNVKRPSIIRRMSSCQNYWSPPRLSQLEDVDIVESGDAPVCSQHLLNDLEMPSAAARTFAVPELLELILLQLGQHDIGHELEDLFLFQSVNRTFRDTIQQSKKLQVLMSLAYEEGDASNPPRNNIDFFNRRSKCFLPLIARCKQNRNKIYTAAIQLNGSNTVVEEFAVDSLTGHDARLASLTKIAASKPGITECEAFAMFERQTSPEASWRRMKLSSSQTRSFITVNVNFPPRVNHNGYTTIAFGNTGSSTPDINGNGFTLGDLYFALETAAKRSSAEHQEFNDDQSSARACCRGFHEAMYDMPCERATIERFCAVRGQENVRPVDYPALVEWAEKKRVHEESKLAVGLNYCQRAAAGTCHVCCAEYMYLDQGSGHILRRKELVEQDHWRYVLEHEANERG
ncbi:hypothetical protein LTR37_012185 [Vermiconidia calcicola]|uniref:Uncharacterized protein n=1 Tax=Vermiconidia calcicola TaxID=1690605 RepID=A0ACC3N023_9PEZI|nr:hypothetical protein LTR37_012185 [Vermiconidia calcicola]